MTTATATTIESAKARVQTANAEAAAANARYMEICERGIAHTYEERQAAEEIRRITGEAAAAAQDELDALLDAKA